MFLGAVGAGAEAATGKTELQGVPLVGEAGGLCGELVQMAVEGTAVAGRETGQGAAVGRLCTLSPVEEPAQTWLADGRLTGRAASQHFTRLPHFALCPPNCEGDL